MVTLTNVYIELLQIHINNSQLIAFSQVKVNGISNTFKSKEAQNNIKFTQTPEYIFRSPHFASLRRNTQC